MFKNLNARALGVAGHQSEIIELALTYGFRGMDLNIVEFASRAKLRGMPYARRLIDSAKITIGTFELPLEWDTDDAAFGEQLQKLPEYAQGAAELGCTRCLATIEPAGDKRPYHENFEFHRHRFGDIGRTLQPYGIRLGIGFRAQEDLRKGQAFQFIHDLDGLSALVKAIGLPNVGMLLDVWNVYLGGASVENVREIPKEQIVAVQLADLPSEERPAGELTEAASRLLPGAGRIDFPAVLRALAEMEYDGPVTVKPSRSAISSTRRDAIVEETAKALDRAWNEAGLTPEGKAAVTAES